MVSNNFCQLKDDEGVLIEPPLERELGLLGLSGLAGVSGSAATVGFGKVNVITGSTAECP